MARVAFIMAGNLWCLALQAHHEGQAGEGDTIFVPWVLPEGQAAGQSGWILLLYPRNIREWMGLGSRPISGL